MLCLSVNMFFNMSVVVDFLDMSSFSPTTPVRKSGLLFLLIHMPALGKAVFQRNPW